MHTDEYLAWLNVLSHSDNLDEEDTRLLISEQVLSELDRQDQKWGQQDHPDFSPKGYDIGRRADWALAENWKRSNAVRAANDALAWDGILLEEVYEALAESDEEALEAELIQVAAVAQQWVAAIRRRRRS